MESTLLNNYVYQLNRILQLLVNTLHSLVVNNLGTKPATLTVVAGLVIYSLIHELLNAKTKLNHSLDNYYSCRDLRSHAVMLLTP